MRTTITQFSSINVGEQFYFADSHGSHIGLIKTKGVVSQYGKDSNYGFYDEDTNTFFVIDGNTTVHLVVENIFSELKVGEKFTHIDKPYVDYGPCIVTAFMPGNKPGFVVIQLNHFYTCPVTSIPVRKLPDEPF